MKLKHLFAAVLVAASLFLTVAAQAQAPPPPSMPPTPVRRLGFYYLDLAGARPLPPYQAWSGYGAVVQDYSSRYLGADPRILALGAKPSDAWTVLQAATPMEPVRYGLRAEVWPSSSLNGAPTTDLPIMNVRVGWLYTRWYINQNDQPATMGMSNYPIDNTVTLLPNTIQVYEYGGVIGTSIGAQCELTMHFWQQNAQPGTGADEYGAVEVPLDRGADVEWG
jgi:hypothetical protein